MSLEGNKATVQAFFNAFDQGDLVRNAALLAADFTGTMPGAPGPLGKEAFQGAGAMFHAAFSQSHHKLLTQVAEGDLVASRSVWSAVHSGSFHDIPPTGRAVGFEFQTMDRVQDGKIAEHHVQFDLMSFMGQLTAAAA